MSSWQQAKQTYIISQIYVLFTRLKMSKRSDKPYLPQCYHISLNTCPFNSIQQISIISGHQQVVAISLERITITDQDNLIMARIWNENIHIKHKAVCSRSLTHHSLSMQIRTCSNTHLNVSTQLVKESSKIKVE